MQNLPAIVDAGFELLGGLITGIVKAIPELVAALPQIIVAIVDGLGALLGSIVEVGTNIVEGIWEGIKGAAGWLLNRVKEWCGSILDGIMGFFGIHSPSTVFRDQVGRYMAQGIGVGFEEEMSSVAARMQRSIPTPTVETIQNAAAGMVNGLSAASAGRGMPMPPSVLQLNNGMRLPLAAALSAPGRPCQPGGGERRMTQLILADNIYLPQTSHDKYKCYPASLGGAGGHDLRTACPGGAGLGGR